MGKPFFLRLLLAFALAFSGSAAQLHSLAHAQHDLASAAQGGKGPAPLKHSTEQCLVVHALDGTAPETGAFLVAGDVSQHVVLPAAVRIGAAPALAFRSRAPPFSA
jgi:hypothetical protein